MTRQGLILAHNSAKNGFKAEIQAHRNPLINPRLMLYFLFGNGQGQRQG